MCGRQYTKNLRRGSACGFAEGGRRFMHKRARAWSTLLQVAVLLSVAAGAAYWLAYAGSAALDREGLKSVVAELRSQAAVGRLLAEQSASGKLTRVFLETQAGQTRKHIESEREGLKPNGVQPEVIAPLMRASTLAGRLDDTYAALPRSYGDPKAAASVEREFDGLFSELKSIEDGLGE